MSLQLRLLRGLLWLGRRRLQAKGLPSAAALRAWSERVAARQPGWPPQVRVRQLNAAGVPCYWVEPAGADPEAAIVYLHGGCYCLGSVASTHRGFIWRLAEAAGCRLLGVEYRLAPEHAFPAALEDSLAAWKWLLETAGAAPGRVALAGDSAGGGLVYATLVALRDAGGPLPAVALAVSPWADLTVSGATIASNDRRDPILYDALLRQTAGWYLAGHDPMDPRASPVYADWRGLPPSLLLAGSSEVLLDDARRLATGLADAGIAVALRAWPEVPHAWPVLRPALAESRAAISLCGRFLAAHLTSGRRQPCGASSA